MMDSSKSNVSCDHEMQNGVKASKSEEDICYRAHFFGPFQIFYHQERVGDAGWRRNKAKTLLKWFLLNPGQRYCADQLIQMLWPDIEREAGMRNLHVTVHYLRHLLEPTLSSRKHSHYLQRNNAHFYWLETDERWWIDIYEIHQYHLNAIGFDQKGLDVQALHCYQRIIHLCNPGFMPEDTYSELFCSFRRYYDQIHTSVLEKLIDLSIKMKSFNDVINYAHQLLDLNPYSEIAIHAIVISDLQQGSAVQAMKKLCNFRRFLNNELGIEPGMLLLSLEKEISCH